MLCEVSILCPNNGLVNEIFNVDETVFHGVWESFCNET